GGTLEKEALPPMVDMRGFRFYGPDKAFRSIFDYIGHYLHFGYNKSGPLVRLTDEIAVPHLSVAAAESIKVSRGQLLINDKVVPVDRKGMVEINFNPPVDYFDISKSMSPIIALARKGKKLKTIRPGDVVLILPLMYSGNTDFKTSPY